MPKPILRHIQSIIQRDSQLGACLQDVESAITNISTATGTHPSGKQVSPPPPIIGMTVAGAGGVHHITINDGSAPLQRGVEYHLEVDTSPSFTNPVGISLGPHRSYRGSFGSGPLHFRAYSSYAGSPPNTPYAHPVAVDAGGAAGPAFPVSTGSGTASCNNPTAGQGAGIASMRLGPDGRTPSL